VARPCWGACHVLVGCCDGLVVGGGGVVVFCVTLVVVLSWQRWGGVGVLFGCGGFGGDGDGDYGCC